MPSARETPRDYDNQCWASAICSADCAARLDQARRLKVGGRAISAEVDMAQIRESRVAASSTDTAAGPTRFPTTESGARPGAPARVP